MIITANLIFILLFLPLIATTESIDDSLSIPSIREDDEGSSTSIPKQWTMTPPDSVNLKPRVVNFNIMVAGLSGLGKTTFCKALLDSWMESASEPAESTSKKKKTEGGGINAQTLTVQESSPLEWYDDSANTILRVRIIDTPGFGNKVDHKNSVQVIRKYIQSCRKEQMQQEMSSQPSSLPFRRKQEERLVHVCLYFLSPGRFLEIDRHFLKNVQQDIPIVPIIAKADTLTDDEISEYRALLKKTLEQEHIQVYDFDSVEMDRQEPKKSTLSFFRRVIRKEKSIVGGTKDTNPLDARLIRSVLQKTTLQSRNFRGRRKGEALAIIARDGMYPWGEAISQDPNHSDLQLIRDLLLSEHTERFLEQSQMQYQQYRTRTITQRNLTSGLKQSVLLGLIAVQLATTLTLDPRIRMRLAQVMKLLPSIRLGRKREKEVHVPVEVEENHDSQLLQEFFPDEAVEENEPTPSRGFFGFFGTPPYDRSTNRK